jgi:putative toxin-antitoxin system antitoxin component (TIGR02293 family)
MATIHPTVIQYIGVEMKSDFDLPKAVENGLPIESLQRIRDAGLTFTEISDLIIAPRTLKHRRSRGEALSHEEADRVVRMARIVSQADRVFANHDKALLWLRSPDDRLENRTPLSMLRTESGGRLVEEMLWQIDEGIYT